MLAAAYVRGAQMRTGGLLPSTLTETPLGLLTEAEVEQILAAGAAASARCRRGSRISAHGRRRRRSMW